MGKIQNDWRIWKKTVDNFLKLIGWGEAPRNIEFNCHKEKHDKTTYGLDFFFPYKSPLVDNTFYNILHHGFIRIYINQRLIDILMPH